jgi:endo-1,4-beta-xylanase
LNAYREFRFFVALSLLGLATSQPHASEMVNYEKWIVSPPILAPSSAQSFDNVAVKDPSIVFADGKYHLFYTSKRSVSSGKEVKYDLGLGYVCAPTLEELSKSKRHDLSKILDADIIAPQVFYFEPQQRWYMIAHKRNPGKKPNLLPIYLTNPNIDNVNEWSAPKTLKTGKTDDSFWIDFWIICDGDNAHLFYADQRGSILRMTCPIDSFPHGFAAETTAVTLRGEDDVASWIAFEAEHVYHVKNPDTYLMIVEGGYYKESKKRYGDARKRFMLGLVADDLAGPWKRIEKDANDFFAHASRLFTEDGGRSTYSQVSHPELIRSDCNQKLEIESFNIQMLFQSFDASATPDDYNYNELPWELSVMRNY